MSFFHTKYTLIVSTESYELSGNLETDDPEVARVAVSALRKAGYLVGVISEKSETSIIVTTTDEDF